MQAEFKSAVDGDRRPLAEILPLSSPFTLYIEPTRLCNFRCFYCMHSTRGVQGGALDRTGYRIGHMRQPLYETLLSQVLSFSPHPKRLVFSGLGEPLMNPRLAQMVSLARRRGFAGRIDIITNAVLLTPRVSDALLGAGVTRLQVSIQGTSARAYQENCAAAVSPQSLVENLSYFYRQKTDASLYVKIIDAQLTDEADKARFFSLFGDVCDQIYIEHLVTLEQQMGDHGGRVDASRNLNNEPIREGRSVCAVPTYHLQIGADGDVFPCPVVGLPRSFALGSLRQSTLAQIWNGEARRAFLCRMLAGHKSEMDVCATCRNHLCMMDEAENLDPYASMLLRKYEPPASGV